MHPTNIKQEVGYLGPLEQILEVGDNHHMVFQEGGYVPFWVTPQEHIATKLSQYDELQLKENTKAELLGNLKIADMDIYVVKGRRVGKLQDISHKHFISVTRRISK